MDIEDTKPHVHDVNAKNQKGTEHFREIAGSLMLILEASGFLCSLINIVEYFLLFHNSASKADFEKWTHCPCIVCQGECARWCLRKRDKAEAAKPQSNGYLGMLYISPAFKCEQHLYFLVCAWSDSTPRSHTTPTPASLTTFQAFMATSKSSPVIPTALPSTGKGKYLAETLIKLSSQTLGFAHCFAFVHLHLRISSAKMVGQRNSLCYLLLAKDPTLPTAPLVPDPKPAAASLSFGASSKNLFVSMDQHIQCAGMFWVIIYQTILLQWGAFTVFMHRQRKLGSNLPSYGWFLLNEGWWCETLHAWRVVWDFTSHNNTFMKGGVRLLHHITIHSWRAMWDFTSNNGTFI